MEKVSVYIYGKHALKEALLHKPRAVKKVFLASHVVDAECTSMENTRSRKRFFTSRAQ
ncbi:MAG: hypothetical protein HYT29_01865 [Parcubacteria group bacterium]|nr:hypothetical protein [Parcubacteria group bacterium]